MTKSVPWVVEIGMSVLPLAVAALFVAAAWASAPNGARRSVVARAALGMVALLGVGATLALSGLLADASRRPPAFAVLMVLCTVATVVTARSSLGAAIARLPLWALVGAQAFRLPLELVMHRAAGASVMPPEMTFGGLNYDIVTGASALALAVASYRGNASRTLVAMWNVMGSALLAIIVAVAFAATPFVRAFGPEHVNTWVLYFPYVWLPTVLVQAALFGHLVVFRRLSADATALQRGTSAPSAAVTAASAPRGS
jgi:hypothetical protein